MCEKVAISYQVVFAFAFVFLFVFVVEKNMCVRSNGLPGSICSPQPSYTWQNFQNNCSIIIVDLNHHLIYVTILSVFSTNFLHCNVFKQCHHFAIKIMIISEKIIYLQQYIYSVHCFNMIKIISNKNIKIILKIFTCSNASLQAILKMNHYYHWSRILKIRKIMFYMTIYFMAI